MATAAAPDMEPATAAAPHDPLADFVALHDDMDGCTHGFDYNVGSAPRWGRIRRPSRTAPGYGFGFTPAQLHKLTPADLAYFRAHPLRTAPGVEIPDGHRKHFPTVTARMVKDLNILSHGDSNTTTPARIVSVVFPAAAELEHVPTYDRPKYDDDDATAELPAPPVSYPATPAAELPAMPDDSRPPATATPAATPAGVVGSIGTAGRHAPPAAPPAAPAPAPAAEMSTRETYNAKRAQEKLERAAKKLETQRRESWTRPARPAPTTPAAPPAARTRTAAELPPHEVERARARVAELATAVDDALETYETAAAAMLRAEIWLEYLEHGPDAIRPND